MVLIYQRIVARRQKLFDNLLVFKISRQLTQMPLLTGNTQPAGRGKRGAKASRPVQLLRSIQKLFKGLRQLCR